MEIDGLTIHRSARLWHELHGDGAVLKAREVVQAMQNAGDRDGTDAWLRIIVAIDELRFVPSGPLS